MKAFFAAVKRSPKIATLVATMVAAVVIPVALHAWGPDRPTYSINAPADHVVFNSITDNPAYGDERNFVRIKDASAPDSTYSDNTTLQSGKQYEVYVYYHNNASTVLNDAAHNSVGVAQNAQLRMEMPAVVHAGETADVNGYISADNANPGTVYDDSQVTATADTALRFVPGSATIHNFGAINGQTLPDSIMTTGTKLGYNALDGVVPGCNEFSGYVTFLVSAETPNFEVTKTVSLGGQKNYQNAVNAPLGATVDYKVQYHNTGNVEQDNVIVKDTLPAGETLVPGSTVIANSKTNGQYNPVGNNDLVAGGINIGAYSPDGNAYIKYSAVVDACGTLTNMVSANTENGSKTASAVVNVACAPGQTPPSQLPVTGTEDGFATVLGLGGLTAAVAYAIRSDRIRNLLRR